jgi:polyisoprenyl-phosphate glycosyltransferase
MADQHAMISVIVPAYHEGALVHTAFARISEVLNSRFNNYEVIFVDDGSEDDTFIELQKLAAKNHNVKVIKLAANAGSHLAIRCGLEHARGDVITFVACDMQEPPELIVTMFDELKAPYEIVLAVRESRDDSWQSKLFSNLFYFIARKIAKIKLPPSGTSMFLISRRTLDVMKNYNERNMPLDSLLMMVGYQSKFVSYHREKRISGKSKWTLAKKLKLFADYFISTSYFPIRFISASGFAFALLGFIWTIYIIIRALLIGDLSSGWPTIVSILLIGFGLTNISLGIIAEYLWRTLDETRSRPKFVIEQTLNMNEK